MSKISEKIYNEYCECTNAKSNDSNAECEYQYMCNSAKKEAVNHPSHYQSKTGIEVIDVIESFDLGFNLGNVIKYVLRCGKKDAAVQELEKAKWYLEREIENRKMSNS